MTEPRQPVIKGRMTAEQLAKLKAAAALVAEVHAGIKQDRAVCPTCGVSHFPVRELWQSAEMLEAALNRLDRVCRYHDGGEGRS